MVKKLKLEYKPCHCPVCGERFMNIKGQPLPNHAQIKCLTKAGNEMELGICRDCIEKGITMETAQAVLAGIQEFWTFEVEVDKTLKAEEKVARKAFHNSHKISDIQGIRYTGHEAEKQARKMGKLK